MLPLFPLRVPLFPGVRCDLRIFEQRYLKLVRNSLANNTPFAIVPIRSGGEVGETPEIFPWGTLVTIVDFTSYPDGIMGITVFGEQRVRVIESWTEDDGLLVAEAELQTPEHQHDPGKSNSDLLTLLKEFATISRLARQFPDETPSLESLGWQLGTLLPLHPAVKMSLLAESDPVNRLELIRRGIRDLVKISQ